MLKLPKALLSFIVIWSRIQHKTVISLKQTFESDLDIQINMQLLSTMIEWIQFNRKQNVKAKDANNKKKKTKNRKECLECLLFKFRYWFSILKNRLGN